MKSKSTVLFCVVVLTAAVSILIPGCAKKDKPTEMAAAETQPEQTEKTPVEEIVYTREDPGPWTGKEGSHLPQISYEKTETGLTVTVMVGHVMDPDQPHFIEWIRLWDGDGELIGEKEFQATDGTADAVFEIEGVPASLKAYEKCNLHGIWMEIVTIE